MANRNTSYNEVLAKKFHHLEYAQGYLINIFEIEKLSIDEALRQTIQAMGLQQFSTKSGLSIQAVSDFVSKRQKWSTDKLTKHIENVFQLKVKLSLVISDDSKVA
jgi:hypothetical protein